MSRLKLLIFLGVIVSGAFSYADNLSGTEGSALTSPSQQAMFSLFMSANEQVKPIASNEDLKKAILAMNKSNFYDSPTLTMIKSLLDNAKTNEERTQTHALLKTVMSPEQHAAFLVFMATNKASKSLATSSTARALFYAKSKWDSTPGPIESLAKKASDMVVGKAESTR